MIISQYTFVILCIVAGFLGFFFGMCSLFVNEYFYNISRYSSYEARTNKQSIGKEENKCEYLHKFLLAIFGTLERADDNKDG